MYYEKGIQIENYGWNNYNFTWMRMIGGEVEDGGGGQGGKKDMHCAKLRRGESKMDISPFSKCYTSIPQRMTWKFYK